MEPCTGTAAALSPAHQVRRAFEQYLLRERGLAAASARLYGDAVGRFLGKAFGEGEVQLDRLTPADIVRFVQAEASRLRHPKRAKVMISALRSFLQYGRYRDLIRSTCMAACRPWRTGRRRSAQDDIASRRYSVCWSDAIDDTAMGRRDFAILLLLARLGLRASEVVDLSWGTSTGTEGSRIRAQRANA